MARRYVRGDRQAIRLLKRLPGTVRQEMIVELNIVGRELAAAEKGGAPFRTGALQSGISFKVLPSQLKLKVGLVGKAINRKLFYGRFVEFGRHGGGRGVTRTSAAYAAGIGAMQARHFVYVAGVRAEIYPAFRAIWTNALKKAAAGAGDD